MVAIAIERRVTIIATALQLLRPKRQRQKSQPQKQRRGQLRRSATQDQEGADIRSRRVARKTTKVADSLLQIPTQSGGNECNRSNAIREL